MALQDSSGKAIWTDIETAELVNFLYENRSEGEGGNFKQATYNTAAQHISQHLSQGPAKTAQMCKTKWTGVSEPHGNLCHELLLSLS
jgi:hypothetical protein